MLEVLIDRVDKRKRLPSYQLLEVFNLLRVALSRRRQLLAIPDFRLDDSIEIEHPLMDLGVEAGQPLKLSLEQFVAVLKILQGCGELALHWCGALGLVLVSGGLLGWEPQLDLRRACFLLWCPEFLHLELYFFKAQLKSAQLLRHIVRLALMEQSTDRIFQ